MQYSTMFTLLLEVVEFRKNITCSLAAEKGGHLNVSHFERRNVLKD